MSDNVKLTKMARSTPLIEEYKIEYVMSPSGGTIEEAAVFSGKTKLGEDVTVFVGHDGSGLLLVTGDADAYVRGLHLQREGSLGAQALLNRGTPAEQEAAPGTFDPNVQEIVLTGIPTLF